MTSSTKKVKDEVVGGELGVGTVVPTFGVPMAEAPAQIGEAEARIVAATKRQSTGIASASSMAPVVDTQA